MKSIFRLLHRAYKLLISPYLGNNCRYSPSCSDYCLEAVESFGFVRGLFLGFKRICRCHPYCQGGIDPLPKK